jgi:hypothetical protein
VGDVVGDVVADVVGGGVDDVPVARPLTAVLDRTASVNVPSARKRESGSLMLAVRLRHGIAEA